MEPVVFRQFGMESREQMFSLAKGDDGSGIPRVGIVFIDWDNSLRRRKERGRDSGDHNYRWICEGSVS